MTLVNNISTIPVAPSVPADGKCGLFQRYKIQFGGLGSLQFGSPGWEIGRLVLISLAVIYKLISSLVRYLPCFCNFTVIKLAVVCDKIYKT